MDEEKILKVAKILDEWNPLGDVANTVDQLDGYYVEVIDIIVIIQIFRGKNKVEKAISEVLTQAFNIDLDKKMLSKASKDVADVLGVQC